LNDILEIFFKNDDLKIAQEFAKVYKVPERRYDKLLNSRFYLTRAKTLIAKRNFDELDRLLAEKNKKAVVIPYEIIADLLIRSGEEEKGLQMLLKMPDVEVHRWLTLGTSESADEDRLDALRSAGRNEPKEDPLVA
jgi:hypothetical protein